MYALSIIYIKHSFNQFSTCRGTPAAAHATGRRAPLGPRTALFPLRSARWTPAALGHTSARTSWTSGPRPTTAPWGRPAPRTRGSPPGSKTRWPPTRPSPSLPRRCTLRWQRRRNRSRNTSKKSPPPWRAAPWSLHANLKLTNRPTCCWLANIRLTSCTVISLPKRPHILQPIGDKTLGPHFHILSAGWTLSQDEFQHFESIFVWTSVGLKDKNNRHGGQLVCVCNDASRSLC